MGERGAPQLELRWAELSQVTGKHNGHSVQVDVPEALTRQQQQQQQVIYQNTTYSMQQFHLHTPSEHRVNGHFYAGEIHFVHKSPEGKLLVIGVFLDVKSHVDSGHAILQPLTRQLPIKAGEQTRPFTTDLSRVKRLTGEPNGFWTYNGSLTTPPCTEGVTWIVLDTPLPLSLAQLATIEESIRFSARHTMQ